MDHRNNSKIKLLNGFHAQHKPFSIFGALLVRKSILYQTVFWAASILSITKAFCKLYMIYNPKIFNVSSDLYSITKYEKILKQLNTLFIGFIILHFKFNRPLYIKYLNAYYSITNNNFGLLSSEFVNKWTKFNKLFLTLSLIAQLVVTLGNYYIHYFHKFGFTFNAFIYSILIYISKCINILAIQFVIECCFYTQSTFLALSYSLDTLLRQNACSLQIDINHIAKSIRLYYSQAIESIRYMDKYLNYAILFFYLYFIGHCIFLFGTLLNSTRSTYLFLISIFEFFVESLYLTLNTYHLVRVNKLSVQMFDKVYQLSYSFNLTQSSEAIHEINLFLLRINRNDVGFTFAGLCLVSPSFVSSLATISLTLGLALPSFIK